MGEGFGEGVSRPMTKYILRRIAAILPTLFLITVFGFLVMEAPSGDFVTSYIVRQYGPRQYRGGEN